MSLFSKNHDREFFSLIEDNNDASDEEFGKKQNVRIDSLTPEEVTDSTAKSNKNAADTGALDTLKKIMHESKSETNTAEDFFAHDISKQKKSPENNESSDVKAENDSFDIKFEPLNKQKSDFDEFPGFDYVKKETNNLENEKKYESKKESGKHFYSDKKEVKTEKPEDLIQNENVPTKSEAALKKHHKKTLLEKCRLYTIDDDGKSAVTDNPTYKLESVAEILSSESQKTLNKLSEHYNISFDDLGKLPSEKPGKVTEKKTSRSIPDIKKETFAKPVEKEVYEDKLPTQKDKQNEKAIHVISDLDAEKIIANEAESEAESFATIKFTPVSDSESTSRISISSQTRSIDLTGELAELTHEKQKEEQSEIKLEQTEFEEYVPDEEFNYDEQPKHLLRVLSLKKRASFLITALSIAFTFILAVAKLPFMTGIILAHQKVSMIICAAITGIIVLLNIKMFVSLPKIFGRKSTPDVSASIASAGVGIYSVFGIMKSENILDILIFLAVILSVRSLCAFFKDSSILANLKEIASASPKRSLKMISDPAVTFAMAKGTIEGDVLAVGEQRTDHIDDYMKYSTFGVFLGGKLPIVTILSLALALITGFACTSYYNSMLSGLYSAAVILCFASLPIIFLIDALPFYHTTIKLNRMGAMISGKTGAEKIEEANAAVVSADELFPSGTVTLHHMTILSENSIDDTIIRAASLTDCLNSPLSPIFKKIVVSGNIVALPDSDTVKYEDRMGISGWVDNKLLFIGNRTLMEAHGIEVPDVETDRKILRQGFFPVYVATEDKACALLVVQYSVRPESVREFRRLSALGVTILVSSSDPNLTEDMICDYLGLYHDSVKVMSAAGCHMYSSTVTTQKHVSAPAAFKGNPTGLAAIINCASKFRKANMLLTVLFALASVMGSVMFAYISFDGSGTMLSGAVALLYALICTVVSLILYLTEKP